MSITVPAPWVVVAGGVNIHGGTDKANYALIAELLNRGHRVHLATHHVDEDKNELVRLFLHYNKYVQHQEWILKTGLGQL